MTKGKDIDIYRVWIQQQNYNNRIKESQNRTDSEWFINYILGAFTELNELLEGTKWKSHRLSSSVDFGPNIEDGLADITKYVLSMWQIMGHTPSTMLDAIYRKGEILDQLYRQEMKEEPSGKKILMLDLDGCVADFRTGFEEWVNKSKWAEHLKPNEGGNGLHIDINYGWDFHTYEEAKLEFEEQGGYKILPAHQQIVSAINTLQRIGWDIIVYTARPYTIYRRIWIDTWEWLVNHGLKVNELHFGYDQRVSVAKKLSSNNIVVAMEDDPTLIRRYVACNIPVFVVQQLYNIDLPQLPLLYYIIEEDTAWNITQAFETYLYLRG